MTRTLTGSCYCEAVRYTLREGPRSPVYACHCTDCQTRTGSAFSEHMTVPLNDLRVEGAFDSFVKARPGGSDYALVGCPKCKVAIYAASGLSPAHVTLRCGTLDRSPAIAPCAHFWVRSKQSWLELPDGAATHETQPDDPMAWIAAHVACGGS